MLAAARVWMPRGTYGYYIENGVPDRLPRPMRDRAMNLMHYFLDTLHEEEFRGSSFAASLVLAGATFADADLPPDASEVVARMAQEKSKALAVAVRMAWGFTDSTRHTRRSSPDDAGRLLAENERVVVLYRILHGEDRLSYNPKTSRVRFGLRDVDLDMLRAKETSEGGRTDTRVSRPRRRRPTP